MNTYSEVCKLKTYEERFAYLKLSGRVGQETFGRSRFLNQTLYKSAEWLRVRRDIILRDNGCDLAVPGYELSFGLTIHHIEPITEDDILSVSDKLFDPDNLITVSQSTHRALHYGTDISLYPSNTVRYPGDTCPWKEETYGRKRT